MADKAEDVARKALPGWIPVGRPSGTREILKVDGYGIDVEAMRRKYFGGPGISTTGRVTPTSFLHGAEDAEIARMRPALSDAAGDIKAVIVHDGKAIGAQG